MGLGISESAVVLSQDVEQNRIRIKHVWTGFAIPTNKGIPMSFRCSIDFMKIPFLPQ
jgi:hypothetical protein